MQFPAHFFIRRKPIFLCTDAVLLVLLLVATPLRAREKDATQYGVGLIVNIPFPENEVLQVVEEVVQNGIIRGSKEYNKDEFITGAVAAASTRGFSEPVESGGKVFYKVRLKAIDPRNFKDGSDIGTLAVRYVVKAQDDKHTILRIDARFVEDFRHTVHASNGSVESAEYKDIHDHLDEIELAKAESEEAKKDVEARRAQQLRPDASASSSSAYSTSAASESGASAPAQMTALPQNLEQRVHTLRQQVERRVKAPGAPLKSAPFHTASTLQSLPEGTEVLIVVSTTYWFGIETHDGQHGWMLRDDLEPVE